MIRDIKLEFKGEVFSIPAHRVFDVGEEVEQIATLTEMSGWAQNPNFHKIARCYCTMLRYAGSTATKEDVFSDMMAEIKRVGGKGADGGRVFFYTAIEALMGLLADGMPQDLVEGDAPVKKTTASSKRRSR